MESSVITPTVHPHFNAEECSTARKLTSVCTEYQVSMNLLLYRILYVYVHMYMHILIIVYYAALL